MKANLSLSVLSLRLTFNFWFFAVIAALALTQRELLTFYIALPVLIHECGHLAAAAICGLRVRELYFTPFCIEIRTDGRFISYVRELAVAFAGSAANLIAALILRCFFFQSMRMMMMVASCLIVGLFNLLPIGNLDGGQIVRLLCSRWLNPQTARTISRAVSFLILTPLTAAAALLVLRGKFNFTILLTCVYLIVVVAARE